MLISIPVIFHVNLLCKLTVFPSASLASGSDEIVAESSTNFTLKPLDVVVKDISCSVYNNTDSTLQSHPPYLYYPNNLLTQIKMVGLGPRRKPSRRGSMADVPKNLQEEIQNLEDQFNVPAEKLIEITNHFVDELTRGLTEEGGDIPMNPSWCMGFPTGNETGTYLALDMGGTNLRVCEIHLPEEKGEFDIIQSKYKMPEDLKTGTAEELWDYIADCLQQFIEYHHEGETMDQLPLGFTFSYPATQDAIDHGVLQRWTKGFDIDGVEGKDVVPPFEAALKERVRIDPAVQRQHDLTLCRECLSSSQH